MLPVVSEILDLKPWLGVRYNICIGLHKPGRPSLKNL
jgi:hypothetical protein